MNQPHQVRNQQPQYDNAGSHGPRPQPNPGNQQPQQKWYQPTIESKIVILLAIIASLLLVAALAANAFTANRNGSAADFVKQDQYQAVFLSNGQVYFGSITGMNSDVLVLEDIFYLQVDQQLQPEQDGGASDPQVSLAKLGNELHGPEDQMFISMNEVVFWENLRDDGDVVQAISQYNGSEGNNDANLEGAQGVPEGAEPTEGVEEAEEPTEDVTE